MEKFIETLKEFLGNNRNITKRKYRIYKKVYNQTIKGVNCG